MSVNRRLRLVGVVLAASALSCTGLAPAHADTAPTVGLDQNRAHLLGDINAFRAGLHLEPVAENARMDDDAQRWARFFSGAPNPPAADDTVATSKMRLRAAQATDDASDVDDDGRTDASSDDDGSNSVGGSMTGFNCVAASYGLDIASIPSWTEMLGSADVTDVGLGYAYDSDGYATEVIDVAQRDDSESARVQPALRTTHVDDDVWTLGPVGGKLGRSSSSVGAGEASDDDSGSRDASDGDDDTIATPAPGVAPIAPHHAPGKPSGVRATRRGHAATVRFKAVVSASRYRVQATWKGGSSRVTGAATSVRLTHLPARARVVVTVRAQNSRGSSAVVKVVIRARD